MKNLKESIINLIDTKFNQIKRNEIQVKEKFDYFLSQKLEGKKVVIFGAGVAGKYDVFSILKKNFINVDYFCDNDSTKNNTIIRNDIYCIDYKNLLKMKNECICFIGIGPKHINEVHRQLINDGFENIIRYEMLMIYNMKNIREQDIGKRCDVVYKIKHVLNRIEDEESLYIFYKIIEWLTLDLNDIDNNSRFNDYSYFQYFGENAEKIKKRKIIVDCGAYVGDSLKLLIEDIKYNGFEEYICFELDKYNFHKLNSYRNSLSQNIKNKIKIYNYGIANRNEKIKYVIDGSGSNKSIIGEKSGYTVPLNDVLKEKNSVFIKMDIEGGEQNALLGADKYIKVKRPDLAISLYHNVYDIWEIPYYILTLLPDYKIKLENHTMCNTDIVGYFTL